MRVILMLVALFTLAVGLLAQDFSKLSDAERENLNAWMAARAERMVATHRLETELAQAWADDKYTSPEVEALRKRYRELQQELAKVQSQLQAKVLELPQLKEKTLKLEQEKSTVKDLSRKIQEKVDATQ